MSEVVDINEKRRLRHAAEALNTPHIPADPKHHIERIRAMLQLGDYRGITRGHDHHNGARGCPVCSLHDPEAHKRDRQYGGLSCPRCVELYQAAERQRRRNA